MCKCNKKVSLTSICIVYVTNFQLNFKWKFHKSAVFKNHSKVNFFEILLLICNLTTWPHTVIIIFHREILFFVPIIFFTTHKKSLIPKKNRSQPWKSFYLYQIKWTKFNYFSFTKRIFTPFIIFFLKLYNRKFSLKHFFFSES